MSIDKDIAKRKRIFPGILIGLLFSFSALAQPGSYSYENFHREEIDTGDTDLEINYLLPWGGESKVPLFGVKFNLLRIHDLKYINPYYGIGAGFHHLLVFGCGTFSLIGGIEKGIFRLESSISHFWTSKYRDIDNLEIGPFNQQLLNLKFAIQIKMVKLKIGNSFILNEKIPSGQDRIPLLNIGNINNRIWCIELEFLLF